MEYKYLKKNTLFYNKIFKKIIKIKLINKKYT